MNSKCLCSHVRDWHYQLNPACAVTACGCTAFRSPQKPDLDRARALAALEVERIKAEMEDEPLKDDPSTLNSDAGDARKLCTCSATHDVATGYGVLRCDLTHPHPGLNHNDPQHRLWWGPAEAVPRAH